MTASCRLRVLILSQFWLRMPGRYELAAVLGDDALQPLPGGRLEERHAVLLDVLAQADDTVLTDERREQLLAAPQRLVAQVVAVEVEQVEHVVQQVPLAGLLIALQELEARLALVIHGHDLAVEHRVVAEIRERLGHGGKLLVVREQPSRVGSHLAAFDLRDGTIAVPLDLEEPAGPIEGLVHGRSEHGLDVVRHRAMTWDRATGRREVLAAPWCSAPGDALTAVAPPALVRLECHTGPSALPAISAMLRIDRTECSCLSTSVFAAPDRDA